MNASFSEIVAGTMVAYMRSAHEASQGLRRNWLILPGAVALFIAFSVLATLVAPLGLAGGFIITISGLAALSLYYHWLSQTVSKQRIKLSDLRDFDVTIFFAIISVSFILWIAEILLGAVAAGGDMRWLSIFFSLGVIFAFNALPEVIYLHRVESVTAFQDAFRFTRDNFVEWYLPFLLLTTPFIILGFETFVISFAASFPLLPVSMVFQVPQQLVTGELSWLAAVLGIVLAHWFMLFRAHLFQELERGSRRQRAFAARQR